MCAGGGSLDFIPNHLKGRALGFDGPNLPSTHINPGHSVQMSNEEKRETTMCDAPGCRAYRLRIDGRIVPHPEVMVFVESAVPADGVLDTWVSREGKDYCPRHAVLNESPVVEDPFKRTLNQELAAAEMAAGFGERPWPDGPLSAAEARAALIGDVESALTSYENDDKPKDLPPPVALVAASTDQTGVRWDAVFYVAVGVLLAALVWCAVEYLK